MEVPFLDFKKLHNENFIKKVEDRFSSLLRNSQFVEGTFNDSFEKKFAEYHKVKHCLLVANGTDALEISLLAYGVRPGDNVGVPAITFYATAEAVLNIGANPVLIDVDPDNLLIDPESIKRVHEKLGLKAVMPVHLYGIPAPIKAINLYCREHQIKVIEDGAQAAGTFIEDSSPVGGNGNLTTFSFYPTKNLSAFGDAGCILTDDDELANFIRTYRNHGRGDLPILGRNSRCDHLQAAVLDLKLEDMKTQNTRRKEVAAKYISLLKDQSFKTISEDYVALSSWHLFPIQFDSIQKCEAVSSALKQKGIGSARFYDYELKSLPILSKAPGENAVANTHFGKTLCLPIHPFITDEQVEYVCEALKSL